MFWYLLAFMVNGQYSNVRISVHNFPTLAICMATAAKDPIVPYVDSAVAAHQSYNLMSISCVPKSVAIKYSRNIK